MDYSKLTFGARLKLAREAAGLSQEHLAAKLGVDQVQVSKWERDDTRPRSERLTEIASAFGDVEHLNWLMSGKGEPPEGVHQADADLSVKKSGVKKISHKDVAKPSPKRRA